MLGSVIDDNVWPSYGPGYGFGAIDEIETGDPIDWSYLGLNNWGCMRERTGNVVSAVAKHGIIDGGMLGTAFAVEVDRNDEWGPGTVRTPMLELGVEDYEFVRQTGRPYDGMVALGDTGEIYTYDGLGGFFKKLVRRVKKGVKKVAKRVKSGIKKVLKKSKFGRFLLKVGGKIKKIAMKIVKPLIKFVGKYAAKLAPIAALIPGFGPAVAGGLMVAGKIANKMKKWGVRTSGEKGKVRNLELKDPKNLPAFKADLEMDAKQMQAWAKRNPKKFRAMSRKHAA